MLPILCVFCWPVAMSANSIHIISQSCAGDRVVSLLACSTDCTIDIRASEKDLKYS